MLNQLQTTCAASANTQGQSWKLFSPFLHSSPPLGCNQILWLLTKPQTAEGSSAWAVVQPASLVPSSIPQVPPPVPRLSQAAGLSGCLSPLQLRGTHQNGERAPGWGPSVLLQQQCNGLKAKGLRTPPSWRPGLSTNRDACLHPVCSERKRLRVFPELTLIFNTCS